ncbi:MAG TPA: PQQ-dependent sugar dehydrogenase, partial [Draconibacterium sp.]|nr:PQQ-dependent sugar dehydrogenase [Draconibacterium sp.]
PDGSILYSSEHGPSSNDEINIIKKGRNYGWPKVEGFCDNVLETAFCNESNVVEPIFAWTPTLAVAGIDFYNSDLIPEWKNSILISSLKASRITQLQLNENATEVVKATDFFTGNFGRLRDICISPEGKVYIAVSNRDGRGSPKAEDDRIIEIAPFSTSIHELTDGNFVSVFPNPASGFINIKFSKSPVKIASYSLYNLSGLILQAGTLESGSSRFYLPANFEGPAILRILADNQLFMEKIMIIR